VVVLLSPRSDPPSGRERVVTRTRPLGGSLLGLTKTTTGQVKFTFIP